MPPRSAKKKPSSTMPQTPQIPTPEVDGQDGAKPPPQIVNEEATAADDAVTAKPDVAKEAEAGVVPDVAKEDEVGVVSEEVEEDVDEVIEEEQDDDVEDACDQEVDEAAQTEMDLCEGSNQVVSKGTGENETEATDGEKAVTSEANNDANDHVNGNENEKETEVNEEEDPSICLQSLSERKKQKEFEIFIGGLEKGAVDEDLVEVFGVYGEIQSLKIIRDPLTQKSKGYAFVRYASVESAKKVLDELKNGVEIRGKKIGIAASQDNDTLYLGNINKTWTKDQVIESLKSCGIEQIEHIILPDDPKNEGKTKGFAFVEFSSHSDAMIAFQRLKKGDVVFGRDIGAKVAFSTSMNPTDNATIQVKTVYIENVPVSWDESELEKVSQQYGEIKKVQLIRRSTKSKKKFFAFVEFTSRESALACVEGMNKSDLGEGEVKIQANLARPSKKGHLAKKGARGGSTINKDGRGIKESGKKTRTGKFRSKKVIVKEKFRQKPDGIESSNKSFKSEGTKRKHDQREVQNQKGRKPNRAGKGISIRERPSKKSRKYHSHGSHDRMPATYEARFAAPAITYQSYPHSRNAGSGSSYHDLAPHAGYLPPVKYNQNQYRSGAYNSQPRASLVYAVAPPPPAVRTTYPGPGSYPVYEAGYPRPSSSGAYHPGGSTYAPYRSYY